MSLSTQAEAAFHSLLFMCDDANGTNPTEVAELRDFTWGVTAKREDTSTHNPDDPWETGIVTQLKMGPVEFEVNYRPTVHGDGDGGILAAMEAREERTWQQHESDESTIVEFNAHVVSMKQTRRVAGVRIGAFTLDGTGKPDFSKA